MRKASRKHRKKQHRIYIAGVITATVILCVDVTIMLLIHFGVFSKKDTTEQGQFFDQVELRQEETEKLGYGLELQGVGRYAGLYLEDGSNDAVTDVLMIKLKNTADKDLQLARICLNYSGFTAEFEVTNLPAGRSVIVLEKNRRASTEQMHESVSVSNVVHFCDPMDVPKEIYHITGMKGAINLENRSEADITGDVYVYYKYIADDTLYGGITFRSKLSGGIPAGQIRQIATSHFDPDQCMILAITNGV